MTLIVELAILAVMTAALILIQRLWSRVETLQQRLDAVERKSTLPKHDPTKSFLTL